MSVHLSTKPAVEAVAVFHDATKLDAAVEALRNAGFKNDALSLLASEHAVEKKLGHRYERVEELEDNKEAPRIAYRTQADLDDSEGTIIGSLTFLPAVIAAGTIVASAGVVAAAVTGTAIAGALIGTVLTRFLDQKHADLLQEQLEHGGLLLWVNTPTEAERDSAVRILLDHGGTDVHVHDFAEASEKSAPHSP
jgi:outer membrane lipoprotein SlyB